MLNDATFERALAMAKKDGQAITEENAEGYFMAALAQEIDMIKSLLNTSKGQAARKVICGNMASRVLAALQ